MSDLARAPIANAIGIDSNASGHGRRRDTLQVFDQGSEAAI